MYCQEQKKWWKVRNIRPGGFVLFLRNFAKSIALGTGVGLCYDSFLSR